MEDQAPYAPTDILAPYAAVLAAEGFFVEARLPGEPVLLATWQPVLPYRYELMLFRSEQGRLYAYLTRLDPAPTFRLFGSVRLEDPSELSWLLGRTRPTFFPEMPAPREAAPGAPPTSRYPWATVESHSKAGPA